MDIFSWIGLFFIGWWLVNKIIEFFQMIFPQIPEWHGKIGEEYIKWKKEKGI